MPKMPFLKVLCLKKAVTNKWLNELTSYKHHFKFELLFHLLIDILINLLDSTLYIGLSSGTCDNVS